MGSSRAYYNEHDPYAATWLRNLMAAGHIAEGDVDERSIEDVYPSDLAGYTQCHFFAGICGWSLALRLAGWPDDRPVWSGSAPCQPFSAAGKGAGQADERHLWPHFHWLIEQRRPAVVFGEQVEAAIGHGWLDLIQADLEGIGYAFAAVGLPAACVGAPHIRQRLFFVADSGSRGLERRDEGEVGRQRAAFERGGSAGGMADTEQRGDRRQIDSAHPGQQEGDRPANRVGGCGGASGGVADNKERGCRKECADVGRVADGDCAQRVAAGLGTSNVIELPGPLDGFWRDADWIYCRDGKWRPVEPGTFPLAHGIPASLGRGIATLGGMARSNRIGRLRGYGNAIVPQVASEFIRAYLGGE